MIWREPTNHANDIYYCLTNVSGYSKRTMSRFVYSDCSSVLSSVTHSHESIPIPSPQLTERDNDSSSAESIDFSQTSKNSVSIASMLSDEQPHLSQAADVSQLLNQNDLKDLVRILRLIKKNSELLSLRLKQLNMMQKGVNCTYFRSRHASHQDLFSVQNNVCYCSNIDCLFESLESEHDSNEWRLFNDSNKARLEAVLLNNGNKKPSIPLTPATALKESHETMELILFLINYSVCNWNICGGLKDIGLFIGTQMGYTSAF